MIPLFCVFPHSRIVEELICHTFIQQAVVRVGEFKLGAEGPNIFYGHGSFGLLAKKFGLEVGRKYSPVPNSLICISPGTPRRGKPSAKTGRKIASHKTSDLITLPDIITLSKRRQRRISKCVTVTPFPFFGLEVNVTYVLDSGH